ncbi:MAG TPA: diacylglycerol kinase family protein [Armatimonadota bacterium]|jgi:YegS/Rv2252/BmrU family lipid kinase
MKTAVILNPTAGQGKPGASIEILKQSLNCCGIDCDILFTEKEGDGSILAREAANRGYDTVVAVGGDGTVNEIINGLAGTGVKLGLIPVGSVNVLAKDMGIPLDLRKAVTVLAAGNVKEIDLGVANGRYFAMMAGIGFDAEVVADVFRPVKDLIGASAYVFKGLEKLATYQATDVVIEMPEETYSGKAFLVVVGNLSSYAWSVKVTPDAVPDDGLLNICVFERPFTDRLGFIHHIADVFVQRHAYHDEIKFFSTTRALIKSNPDVMMQIDGELFGTTPADISVISRALPLIVPGG